MIALYSVADKQVIFIQAKTLKSFCENIKTKYSNITHKRKREDSQLRGSIPVKIIWQLY